MQRLLGISEMIPVEEELDRIIWENVPPYRTRAPEIMILLLFQYPGNGFWKCNKQLDSFPFSRIEMEYSTPDSASTEIDDALDRP